MRSFDERYKRTTWPYGSGVWGKKEWVCPEHPRREHRLDGRGRHQPVLGRALRPASSALDDLWVKQCGNSHTGSFKDLGMTVLVSVVKQMIADGAPIDAVACASTGDTSAALAAYCAAAGIPAGRDPAAAARSRPRSSCSRSPTARCVLSLDTDFDGCMAIVQRLAEEERRLPGQLDEQPAPRGPEDASRSRSCSSSTGRCRTGSSSPAATSATSARSAPAST